MHIKSKLGRIVWHDFLTNDVAKAKHFYAELFGWRYHVEHASDFAWKAGEADYPLIFTNGEAHGGFVDPGQNISSHWLAFVSVEDVDTVTAKAKTLGATLNREPFDVPGVGRSVVIQDPQGAITCPYSPTHNVPPPNGLFLWDELITPDIESAKLFYRELYGWKASAVDMGQEKIYTLFKRANGPDAAGAMKQRFKMATSSTWVTYLATNDIDTTVAKAKALGATVYLEGNDGLSVGRIALLLDPTGGVFGLMEINQGS